MLEWLQSVLTDYGYWVIFLAVFANNIGLPIPGDATLLGSGFLVEKGTFSFWGIVATGTVACFLGGNCGYLIGLNYGRRLLHKIPWFRSNPERLKSLDRFFQKHGPKSVFFARFVSLLQPITGLMAGMGKTPWRPFLLYNLAGSVAYAIIYTAVGHFFGQRWGLIKEWLGITALYLILIALVLALFFLLRSDRKRVPETRGREARTRSGKKQAGRPS